MCWALPSSSSKTSRAQALLGKGLIWLSTGEARCSFSPVRPVRLPWLFLSWFPGSAGWRLVGSVRWSVSSRWTWMVALPLGGSVFNAGVEAHALLCRPVRARDTGTGSVRCWEQRSAHLEMPKPGQGFGGPQLSLWVVQEKSRAQSAAVPFPGLLGCTEREDTRLLNPWASWKPSAGPFPGLGSP